jgi:nitrogen fixation-related uncharacterized protein
MRRTLIVATITIALIGGGIFLWVLSDSMQPSQLADSKRSSHDISGLEPGGYLIEDFKQDKAQNMRVLILKDWSNELNVFLVPVESNLVQMPDIWWGRKAFLCREFGPDLREDGKVVKDGRIRCHDSGDLEQWSEQYAWEYSGKSNYEYAHDLIKPSYELVGSNVAINR